MKQLKLAVTKREKTGTSEAKRNRASGNIPAIIYGKSGNQSVIVNDKDLRLMLREAHGSAALIQVTDNDNTQKLCIIQEMNRHPLTDKFLHIDFHELSQDKPMTTHIPVHTTGEPVGVVKDGGVFELNTHQIDIKCLPKDLPEEILLDISALNIGDAIHLRDVKPIQGVTFLGEPDMTLASCHSPQKMEEPAEEETAEEGEEPAEETTAEGETKE